MKYKIIFIVIIIIASLLRLWDLTAFPAGFNADEAAIGYNAYSLLKTGRDEYGTVLPLSFKSFSDYKPGIYFYMVAPFVVLMGLTEIAVRLPSALLGIGTVILIYFLAKEIFESEKVALVASFLLAITPWYIHFSRGGWESNAATFFITLGVYFLIRYLEQGKYLFWSLLSFLISMYLYQSPRLIIPLLLFTVFIIYRKTFLVSFKKLILPFVVILILSIPLILQFTSGEGSSRFSGLSFLSDPGPGSRVNELRGEHQDLNNLDAKILHNKLTAYVPNFLQHYLDHFTPNFLFINGDEVIRNKVPETGQFYLIESIFLAFGLFGLIALKSKYKSLIVIWLLIAPIASSLTFQTPSALRSLNMVIPFTLIMAYGFWIILSRFKGSEKYIIWAVIFVALVFETTHYLESYYVHYPKRYPLAWEYGFSEMVGKLNKYEGQYNNVVITDRYDQPYILVLFYKKYDPSKYQPQAVLTERDKFNFGTVKSFDKYQFREINPDEVKKTDKTLFIGTEKEISPDATIIDKIDFPNGRPAFIFAERTW